MIEDAAGIGVYKYKVEKKLYDFICFFTYLLLFAQGGNYSPIRIHKDAFNDLYYFHKIETF